MENQKRLEFLNERQKEIKNRITEIEEKTNKTITKLQQKLIICRTRITRVRNRQQLLQQDLQREYPQGSHVEHTNTRLRQMLNSQFTLYERQKNLVSESEILVENIQREKQLLEQARKTYQRQLDFFQNSK